MKMDKEVSQTKKEQLNLAKFNKNKKQKRMIIGAIIGILLVIGGITLYRAYALYEEKKEFNVLKGQIFDFGYDIKMLSVVVDDKKEDSIPARGLYKTNVDCTNGTRGEWDYNAWNLKLENVSSNSKCNITFTSNLTEEEYNKYIEAGKALRRNTYRGKDITSYHNDGSLYTMIQNGTFDDIYVGDYIVANNVTWLVADIDNYLYTGDTAEGLVNHHLTIIPARTFSSAPMDDTGTTENGYLGSSMVTTTLPSILNNIVKPVFGDHVLVYRNVLSKHVLKTSTNRYGIAGGVTDSIEWADRQIDLMSEINVYGSIVASSSVLDTGIDHQQYAIFQLKPEFINGYNGKMNYWLKDVADFYRFAFVSTNGNAYANSVTLTSIGVRPRFLIG